MPINADFYTDLHKFAKNDHKQELPTKSSTHVYLLGDIFDMANCKRSQVKEVQAEITRYKKMFGKNYRLGNHERQRDRDLFLQIGYGIGIMHGDEISWGQKRSMDYRSGELGAGFFKRVLFTEAREIVEHGWERHLSEEDLIRADEIMGANGCHTVIIGHCHPKEQRVYRTPKGRRVIVLKRGKTTLDLSTLDQLPLTVVD